MRVLTVPVGDWDTRKRERRNLSAVPKRDNTGFWMETRVQTDVLPLPDIIEPQPAPRVITKPGTETAPSAELTIAPLTLVLKFERAISIAIIVFALMTLSSISLQSLTARIQARDSRLAIQTTRTETGQLREELQQARSDLETYDAPEAAGTLPIEPADVAILTLPPPTR